jgi:DNA-directed RNA polymerase sigma subunit (sigma70/sigma32)
LTPFDADARETPGHGRGEHLDPNQRPRARGHHAAAVTAAPPRRRAPRRRPPRPEEHRPTPAEARAAAAETGSMTENSLDLFLRSARAHSLLTAAEEIELAKRIERGDLAAKERTCVWSSRRRAVTRAMACRWRTLSRRACWA